MTSTTVLTTLRGTCAALALAVLLTGCQADSDRTATPVPAASATTAAAPTPDPTDEPSTDPADDQTTDPASSTTAVAGYAPGEIPPVPLITIPDLSMLDASLSGFTHEITELVGDYPGLTVAPASCDVSGTVRSGAGSILLYGDGSGVYTGPDGTTVNYGDGSGTYVVDGVSVTVYGDGSGTRTDSTGTITNYGDGGGVFAGADGVTITNYGDGSGLYSDGSVTIQNDGQGTATVNGVPVPADPVPPVPAMGVFPPMGTIEPITSCGTTISLSDAALFDFGTSDLRPESEQTLDSLAAALAETGAPTLQIGGHTDSISDEAFNQQLSEDRAQAVTDALVERGVTATLETTGYGETRPVAPETTADGSDNPAGRQLNRRVEIFVPTF